jgi:hypothetical protein
MSPRRRRSRPTLHEVANLPPPWKRSLTESGMSRRTTDLDRVVVAVFILALAAMLLWLILASG